MGDALREEEGATPRKKGPEIGCMGDEMLGGRRRVPHLGIRSGLYRPSRLRPRQPRAQLRAEA